MVRTHEVHGAVEEGGLKGRGRARNCLALPALLACVVLQAHLYALPHQCFAQHALV